MFLRVVDGLISFDASATIKLCSLDMALHYGPKILDRIKLGRIRRKIDASVDCVYACMCV